MASAVFVQKETGDIRICVDYLELNKKTANEAYLLPHPNEVQDRLLGLVNPVDHYKTAFYPGPGLRLFHFCRTPFGFSGALSKINGQAVL